MIVCHHIIERDLYWHEYGKNADDGNQDIYSQQLKVISKTAGLKGGFVN